VTFWGRLARQTMFETCNNTIAVVSELRSFGGSFRKEKIDSGRKWDRGLMEICESASCITGMMAKESRVIDFGRMRHSMHALSCIKLPESFHTFWVEAIAHRVP
jgi:hypothetical protein